MTCLRLERESWPEPGLLTLMSNILHLPNQTSLSLAGDTLHLPNLHQSSEDQRCFSSISSCPEPKITLIGLTTLAKLIPRDFKDNLFHLGSHQLQLQKSLIMDIRKMASDTGLFDEIRSTETKENGVHRIRRKTLQGESMTNPGVLGRPQSNTLISSYP